MKLKIFFGISTVPHFCGEKFFFRDNEFMTREKIKE